MFVCLCVCVCPLFLKKKIIAGGPLGPPVIFFYNILHTININIHFEIKLKNFLGPKILSMYVYVRHDQKIAKLLFSVQSTQFTFKLNMQFKKK